MKNKLNKFDKYLVFREDFRSIKSVCDNGGSISGTPTINNGFNVTVNNQYISFGRNYLSNLTKATINLDFTTKSDLTGSTNLLTVWGSGSPQISVAYGGSSMNVYVASSLADGGSNVANFTGLAVNTNYKLSIVYDGAGATNADRLKMYVNGVYAPFQSFNGTIATKLTSSSAALYFCGYEAAGGVSMAGMKINACSLFSTAFSAEEVSDFYQKDTYSEIDIKNSKVHLPLKSWYYKKNGVELVVGSNMVLTNWATGHGATLSNPETGVLRVTGDGVTTIPLAYQVITTIGKRYKVTGEGRGDGAAQVPRLSDDLEEKWKGTTSTSWQPFSVEFTAAGTFGRLYLTGLGATGYCDFRNVSVQLMEAKTKNKGSLDGDAKLGDGVTTTTFPTQISPNGISFDGDDYIDTGMLTDYVQSNTPFSVTAYIKNFDIVTGLNYGLMSTIDFAQDYRGWEVGMGNLGGAKLRLSILSALTGNKYLAVTAPTNSRLTGTVTFTYDGSGAASGVKIYQDGEPLTTTIDTDGLAGLTVSNGKSALISGRWSGTAVNSNLRAGTQLKFLTFFPFALTPSQVRAAHKNILNLINQ